MFAGMLPHLGVALAKQSAVARMQGSWKQATQQSCQLRRQVFIKQQLHAA